MKCWCDFANPLGPWWFKNLGLDDSRRVKPSHLSLLSARLPPHQPGEWRVNKQDSLKRDVVFKVFFYDLSVPPGEDSLSFPTAWGPEPPHPHVRSTISASIWKLQDFMVSWLVAFGPFQAVYKHSSIGSSPQVRLKIENAWVATTKFLLKVLKLHILLQVSSEKIFKREIHDQGKKMEYFCWGSKHLGFEIHSKKLGIFHHLSTIFESLQRLLRRKS